MSLRDWLRSVWNDPVWSKVIAATIVASCGYLAVRLRPDLLQVIGSSRVATALVAGFATAVLVSLWIWLRKTSKTLVFMSLGGAGRDPMAKAIAGKLLGTRKLKHPLDIRAVGLAPVTATQAEYAARYVINEMYGEDLLKDHKPAQLTPGLIKKADLILVMDRALLARAGRSLPGQKTFVLKEFFGATGNVDVVDPYPDGMDDATLVKYRACAEELRQVLSQNLDRLIRALEL